MITSLTVTPVTAASAASAYVTPPPWSQYKGAYSAGATYLKNDVVTFNYSSWICLAASSTGVAPPSTEPAAPSATWGVVASGADPSALNAATTAAAGSATAAAGSATAAGNSATAAASSATTAAGSATAAGNSATAAAGSATAAAGSATDAGNSATAAASSAAAAAASAASINLGNIVVTGGSVDGTPIGQTSPAAGKFTTLVGTGAAAFASLDSTAIGQTTPAAGKFTTLTATGKASLAAAGSGAASLNVPHGSAPTAPLNGDVWTTTVGLYAQINGATVGPLAASSAQLAGFRNRLINGSMRIDQRNAGTAQTIVAGAAKAYTVDRFYAYCAGANVSGQRVTSGGGFLYQFTGAAGVTGIGFGQRIEAQNCSDLAGTTATLSVALANSLLTNVTWTAYYANSSDTFGTLASPTRTQIATGTFTGVSGALGTFSTQIPLPAAATTGIEIVLSVGAQTSGTWQIGSLQLEPGASPTTFESRPIGVELVNARRYYQSSYAMAGIAVATLGGASGDDYKFSGAFAGVAVNTADFYSFGKYTLPVTMRTTPVAIMRSPKDNTTNFYDLNASTNSGSIAVSHLGPGGFRVSCGNSALVAAHVSICHWEMDAEL